MDLEHLVTTAISYPDYLWETKVFQHLLICHTMDSDSTELLLYLIVSALC